MAILTTGWSSVRLGTAGADGETALRISIAITFVVYSILHFYVLFVAEPTDLPIWWWNFVGWASNTFSVINAYANLTYSLRGYMPSLYVLGTIFGTVVFGLTVAFSRGLKLKVYDDLGRVNHGKVVLAVGVVLLIDVVIIAFVFLMPDRGSSAEAFGFRSVLRTMMESKVGNQILMPSIMLFANYWLGSQVAWLTRTVVKTINKLTVRS